ncbi:hypothetical protein C0075_14200 [Rhizobium sp. KAs_5_22]|uniref:hypothetical protein n=1 Tax=Ciceribacter selenitireducens TaxID=448181 RepID=UPI0004BBF4B9|nr:hypothetical protein [Ciceribacter selenitireducens]PPJ46779.1 hypothetical protein C0075_14200 [Rhizobium sp. KAs_5_22]
MVSSINSAQLASTQIFLRVLKEEKQASGSSSNDDYYASALNNLMRDYGQGDDAESETYDTSLLRAIGAAGGADDSTEEEAPISDDIQTASFMKGLKAKLVEMKSSGDGALKAKEMLEALEAGTLTVTDAVNGRKIKAWDVADDKADRTAEQTSRSDWSSFLKTQLSRDKSGGYELTKAGAHIDKASGESASLVTVDGTYVYVTWPATTADSAA